MEAAKYQRLESFKILNFKKETLAKKFVENIKNQNEAIVKENLKGD
jgi:hypothetical protein